MTPAEAILRRLLDYEDVGYTELWLTEDQGSGHWILDGGLELNADEVAYLLSIGAKPEETQ